MKCSSIRGLLSEYIDGLLDPEQEEVVKRHLLKCKSCSGELASLEKVTEALASLEQVKAPDNFLGQIYNRIEGGSWWKRLLKTLFVPVGVKIPLECFGVLVTAVLVSFIFRELRFTPELKPAFPPPLSQQAPKIEKPPEIKREVREIENFLSLEQIPSTKQVPSTPLKKEKNIGGTPLKETVKPNSLPETGSTVAQDTLPERGTEVFDKSQPVGKAIDRAELPSAELPSRHRSRPTLTPSPFSETHAQRKSSAPSSPPRAESEEKESIKGKGALLELEEKDNKEEGGWGLMETGQSIELTLNLIKPLPLPEEVPLEDKVLSDRSKAIKGPETEKEYLGMSSKNAFLAKKGYHSERFKGESIERQRMHPEKEGAEGISCLIFIIEKVGGVYLSSEFDKTHPGITSILADIPAKHYDAFLKELKGLGTLQAPPLPQGFSEGESEKNIRVRLHLNQRGSSP